MQNTIRAVLKFRCQVHVSPKLCKQMKNFLKSCLREWSTATVNTICIVQEFLARNKHCVEFVILQRTKIFLTWEKLEDYSKLEKRLLLVDSRSNWVSRVESELLQAKQRPFWFDESCRNQQLRRKKWRIKCQLTFERYCTNHMLGTLDFTSSEHWPPSIFLRAQPWHVKPVMIPCQE